MPWSGDVKSFQKENPKVSDIFFSVPVSPLNSTLYTGRSAFCYSLFQMLINRLLELNEILICLIVAVSRRINAMLTQYIYIYRVKLETLFEGNPKSPFSIATTPWSWGKRYCLVWIVPLTLDTYPIMLSVKQGGIKYYFFSIWYDSTW